MTEIVFHVPRSWLSLTGEGLRPFYVRVLEGLRARGVPYDVTVLDRDTLAEAVEADKAVHVVHHGRFPHPRARNADVAYVYPFWNFDPKGIRAFSSIGDARFDPDAVDPEIARPFFRRVRKRNVGGRRSRYEQPGAHTHLAGVKAAVFLQSEGHRVVGETCHLTRWQMLEEVCETVDGPVVVKPHPRDRDPETASALASYMRQYPHLQISDGNIHDLIAAAERVVTINSAVGIEAYLHRKPVTLCGQADFHHIADVARDTGALRRLLSRPVRRRAYDKYVWWYFGHHCLDASAPDLVDRVLSRCGLGP